jgi:hypothetical protein
MKFEPYFKAHVLYGPRTGLIIPETRCAGPLPRRSRSLWKRAPDKEALHYCRIENGRQQKRPSTILAAAAAGVCLSATARSRVPPRDKAERSHSGVRERLQLHGMRQASVRAKTPRLFARDAYMVHKAAAHAHGEQESRSTFSQARTRP